MQTGQSWRHVEAGAEANRRRQTIGLWLLGLAGMVFVMVCLGGLTRLTGSGLSMVEWQPLSFLPPLSDPAWQAMFAKYQTSPQYRLLNSGMSLADFKGIFWLEYVHRLWGRLIGFAFLVPFLVFLSKGWIQRTDLPRLLLLFILGGLQGVLGWLMVASGLAVRPEVSHYRLVAHLLAALVIYGALLWSALDFLRARAGRVNDAALDRLHRPLLGLFWLVCLTIPAGGLVAGLHAGLVYNSFPLMNGAWWPSEVLDMVPAWLNVFENHALVQFDHRLLAEITWAASVALWLWFR